MAGTMVVLVLAMLSAGAGGCGSKTSDTGGRGGDTGVGGGDTGADRHTDTFTGEEGSGDSGACDTSVSDTPPFDTALPGFDRALPRFEGGTTTGSEYISIYGSDEDWTILLVVDLVLSREAGPSSGVEGTYEFPVASEGTVWEGGTAASVVVLLGRELYNADCFGVEEEPAVVVRYVGEAGTVTVHLSSEGTAYLELAEVQVVNPRYGWTYVIDHYTSPEFTFDECYWFG